MLPPNNRLDTPITSELVRDDPSFEDIVLQFVEGLKGRVSSMEAALRASDFDALRTAAHQLKGSGGGYGYPILTEQAAQLERHAKSHARDACTATLRELQDLCSNIAVRA